MAKRHATDEGGGDHTLCGRPRASVEVSNHDPTCGICLRVIASRCLDHNRTRCPTCPRTWRIGIV